MISLLVAYYQKLDKVETISNEMNSIQYFERLIHLFSDI